MSRTSGSVFFSWIVAAVWNGTDTGNDMVSSMKTVVSFPGTGKWTWGICGVSSAQETINVIYTKLC